MYRIVERGTRHGDSDGGDGSRGRSLLLPYHHHRRSLYNLSLQWLPRTADIIQAA